ncbi:MAG: hypothetical protein ACOY6K_12560 [Pseudomonadota bacterium]
MTLLDRACDVVALHPVIAGLGVVLMFAALSAAAALIGVGLARGLVALAGLIGGRRHG